MTQTSERFDKLADQMSTRIAAVPADAWDNQTPCEDWTARQLLDHLIDAPAIFFQMAELDPIPAGGPDRTEDPQGAFEHMRAAVQAALDDPAVATKEFDGFGGRTSFERGVDQFVCTDLVVHQWDLARATGQDETLPADEVATIHATLLPVADFLRTPGVFGPEIDAPEGADAQTKFLCFLGRQP